jgi:hypothetical protein
MPTLNLSLLNGGLGLHPLASRGSPPSLASLSRMMTSTVQAAPSV